MASSKKVLNRIVHLAKDTNDWKLLNEQLILLSKKHGQLKAAVASMVQEVSTFLDDTPNLDIKIQTIETIRTVTESKVSNYTIICVFLLPLISMFFIDLCGSRKSKSYKNFGKN